MGSLREKSIIRFLVLPFAAYFLTAFSHAQGPAPSVTENRYRGKPQTQKQQTNAPVQANTVVAEIAVSDIKAKVQLPEATAKTLVKAKQFEPCVGHRCTWKVTPWPFTGLELSPSSGVISGTPKETDVKIAHVQVEATDENGKSYKALVFIEVVPETPRTPLKGRPSVNASGEIEVPKITVRVPVPDDTANTLKNAQQFNQCAEKCNWSVEPWPFTDLGLDPSTGVIFGTPTNIGQAHVRVVATNRSNGRTYPAPVFIEVVPETVTVTTTTIPAYAAGEAIQEFLKAAPDEPGRYLWTRLDGPPLPRGVTLDANGLLSGIATDAGTYPFTATVTDTKAPSSPGGDNQPPANPATKELKLIIDAAPGCGNEKYATNTTHSYFNRWFPLSRKRNIDPLGNSLQTKQWPTESDVQCFYNTSSLVSAVGKVQYLYGFDGGANTLSADLMSVVMPAPFGTQVSFGSSVTGGGAGTPAASSNPSQTQPTVSAALQSVEAGGNFYIHTLYPMGQYVSPHLSLNLYLDPRIGFGFNGFANQATLSQGTEQYFSLPVEAYGSYDGIGHAGGVYLDYRGGFESVPGSFARNAGLSQHNFHLHQLAFGFDFAGLFRIGAQKFFGPSAAFNAANTSANSFSKWHLVIQLSPKGSKPQQ